MMMIDDNDNDDDDDDEMMMMMMVMMMMMMIKRYTKTEYKNYKWFKRTKDHSFPRTVKRMQFIVYDGKVESIISFLPVG